MTRTSDQGNDETHTQLAEPMSSLGSAQEGVFLDHQNTHANVVTTQKSWIIGIPWENNASTLVTENLLQITNYGIFGSRAVWAFSIPIGLILGVPHADDSYCFELRGNSHKTNLTCLFGLSRYITGLGQILVKRLFKLKKMYIHICATTLTVLSEYTLSSLTSTYHSCFHKRPTMPPQKSVFTYFFILFFKHFRL